MANINNKDMKNNKNIKIKNKTYVYDVFYDVFDIINSIPKASKKLKILRKEKISIEKILIGKNLHQHQNHHPSFLDLFINIAKSFDVIEKSKVKDLHAMSNTYSLLHLFAKQYFINYFIENIDKSIKNNNLSNNLSNNLKDSLNDNSEKQSEHKQISLEEIIINCIKKIESTASETCKKLNLKKENFYNFVNEYINDSIKQLSEVVKIMQKDIQQGKFNYETLHRFFFFYEVIKKFEKFIPEMSQIIIDASKKAINYAMSFVDFVYTQLQNPSLYLNNPNFNFLIDFFSDEQQNNYDFVKQVVNLLKESPNVNSERVEKRINENEIILKNKKEMFSDFVTNLQTFYEKKAKSLAFNADPNYKLYLDAFIKISTQYADLLEEDKADVKTMHNICNPDLHVKINAERNANAKNNQYNQRNQLELYRLYKSLPETSLAKVVLDTKLDYITQLRQISLIMRTFFFS